MAVTTAEFCLNEFQKPNGCTVCIFFFLLVFKIIQIRQPVLGLAVKFVAYIYMMPRFSLSYFLCS